MNEITTAVLRDKYNLTVKEEWLHECLQFINRHHRNLNQSGLMMAIFEQYLHSDLNMIGAADTSPQRDISQMHNEFIKGPLVVQIDEIIDISTTLEEQATQQEHSQSNADEAGTSGEADDRSGQHDDGHGQELDEGIQAFQETFDKFGGDKKQSTRRSTRNRMLKLSMTDGARRLFAIEYRYCPMLALDISPGIKIVIRDVFVRRGLLLLVPECVQVLGGSVEELVQMRSNTIAMRRGTAMKEEPPQHIRPEQIDLDSDSDSSSSDVSLLSIEDDD